MPRRAGRLPLEPRPPDVIHIHDWHAVPALSRSATARAIPSSAARGVPPDHPQPRVSRLDAGGAGAGARARAATRCRKGADGLDLLRTAIERADLVNTVSPGFAAEALTPEYGMGLDGALRARGDRFLGILNGLDTELWDPATDARLAAQLLPRRIVAARPAAGRRCSRSSGWNRTRAGRSWR